MSLNSRSLYPLIPGLCLQEASMCGWHMTLRWTCFPETADGSWHGDFSGWFSVLEEQDTRRACWHWSSGHVHLGKCDGAAGRGSFPSLFTALEQEIRFLVMSLECAGLKSIRAGRNKSWGRSLHNLNFSSVAKRACLFNIYVDWLKWEGLQNESLIGWALASLGCLTVVMTYCSWMSCMECWAC